MAKAAVKTEELPLAEPMPAEEAKPTKARATKGTAVAVATPAAPAAPPAAITPMDMLKVAVDRGADLEQLEKLMDLQERWEKNQAKKAFVEALSAFKADPPTVIKSKRAGFDSKTTGNRTEYAFAPLAAAVAPSLKMGSISGNLSNQGLMSRFVCPTWRCPSQCCA